MFPDIARERFHIVMNQRIAQPRRCAFDDDVLMHFHIGHGRVLILQAAFIASLAAAKQ